MRNGKLHMTWDSTTLTVEAQNSPDSIAPYGGHASFSVCDFALLCVLVRLQLFVQLNEMKSHGTNQIICLKCAYLFLIQQKSVQIQKESEALFLSFTVIH